MTEAEEFEIRYHNKNIFCRNAFPPLLEEKKGRRRGETFKAFVISLFSIQYLAMNSIVG